MKPNINLDELNQLLRAEGAKPTGLCHRCDEAEIVDKGYCAECLADFISKPDAARLLNITAPNMERLLEKYPESLRVYPYLSQVRLSKRELALFAAEHPDPKALTNPVWSEHFTKCRTCKTTDRPHYGGGYCEQCYADATEALVLQGYIDGENLAEVGKRLGFSRERARQMFARAVDIEISRLGKDIPEQVQQEVREQIELTYKQNRSVKKFKHIIDQKYDETMRQLSQKLIFSGAGLLKMLGLPASAIHVIEDQYPEFLEIISQNKQLWSWKYNECRLCGTTAVKHKIWGYCQNCYTRSDEWKQQQYKYRTTHYEKFRARQKAYEAEYYKRPEVKERMIQKSYDKRYDGNRNAALQASSFACHDCGITREDHKAKYGQDLGVFHVDGNLANNDLTNLIALCKPCTSRRHRKNDSKN